MHLVLTVGKNPVPVLVAANRLIRSYVAEGVTLLHSAKSEPEALATQTILKAKLRTDGISIPPIELKCVDDDDLATITTALTAIDGDVHLHYTGGKKRMALGALKALLESRRRDVKTSYLDIDTHLLLKEDGSLVAPNCSDERSEWGLTLEELVQLHGLEMNFRASIPRPYRCGTTLGRTDSTIPNPEYWPSDGLCAIAQHMLGALIHKDIAKIWGGEIHKRFNDGCFPKLPDPARAPEKGWNWPVLTDAGEWAEIPAMLNEEFGSCWNFARDIWSFCPERLNPVALHTLGKFLRSGWLETAVYASLPKGRTFQGVRLKRNDPTIASPFELDVVMIRGYQAVTFSVTQKSEGIMEKAYEIWHRVRQLGGDGARAVLVTMVEKTKAMDIENDLYVDFGMKDRTLRIWSREECRNLAGSVDQYLRDLQ